MNKIVSPHVNMVVCKRRSISYMYGQDLSSWGRHDRKPFDQKVTLSQGMIDHSSLNKLVCLTSDLPVYVNDFLFKDFGDLTNTFAKLAGTNTFHMFFGIVNTDQCCKFHADFLRLRLQCTYSGLGIEWAPNEIVNRDAMVNSSKIPYIANSSIITNMSHIKHAIAGDVLLMKGNNFGNALGVVHRSPPIESTKRARVVLMLSDFRKRK